MCFVSIQIAFVTTLRKRHVGSTEVTVLTFEGSISSKVRNRTACVPCNYINGHWKMAINHTYLIKKMFFTSYDNSICNSFTSRYNFLYAAEQKQALSLISSVLKVPRAEQNNSKYSFWRISKGNKQRNKFLEFTSISTKKFKKMINWYYSMSRYKITLDI